jgi:hypothetical protein
MWDTVMLRDIQLQYSNDNSIYSQQFGFTLSKKQNERSEVGTGTELIVQTHAVSHIGNPDAQIIGRNKLTCDWPDRPVP